MWWQSTALAIRSIRRHLLRSILTVLGIVIGVASVVTMVTLGREVTATVQGQIASLGGNSLLVIPVQDRRRGQGGGWPKPFKPADVAAIRGQVAGLRVVSGQTGASATAIASGHNWPTSINGAGNDYMAAQNIVVTDGRAFTAREEAAGSGVCLLGTTVVANLYDAGQEPVGTTVRLGSVPCRVIGVLKSRGSGGGQDQDDTIMMPARAVQRRFTGNQDVHWLVAATDPSFDHDAVRDALAALVRERRHLGPGTPDDFNIIDMRQINDTATQSLQTLTGLVGAVASISLLVGGIGIMNIMLVSVTERTREIGIRLAIGALAREVRRQFLVEATVLSLFGGVIGLLFAGALSAGLSALMTMPFRFDPQINAIGLGFSALIGIVFGYFPARRAAALDPIAALRHE